MKFLAFVFHLNEWRDHDAPIHTCVRCGDICRNRMEILIEPPINDTTAQRVAESQQQSRFDTKLTVYICAEHAAMGMILFNAGPSGIAVAMRVLSAAEDRKTLTVAGIIDHGQESGTLALYTDQADAAKIYQMLMSGQADAIQVSFSEGE